MTILGLLIVLTAVVVVWFFVPRRKKAAAASGQVVVFVRPVAMLGWSLFLTGFAGFLSVQAIKLAVPNLFVPAVLFGGIGVVLAVLAFRYLIRAGRALRS